jgi:hypothetical protein
MRFMPNTLQLKAWRWLLPAMLMALASLPAQAFDHTHRDWNALLTKHVRLVADGKASQLDYAGVARERAALKTYLDHLAAVGEADYRQWPKARRLAFLINAYNAWTVEMILGRYPDLKSIKDLGSLFQSPWKRKFVPLFGQEVSLDDIEHGMIRAQGEFREFDDPRFHAAVNCASIGCPMLRAEAFVAERLDAQLEDAMRRFLADRGRNRFDAASGQLRVSKIFDWYGKDFEKGLQGFTSLTATFARYAEHLADTPAARERIKRGDYRIEFQDYDWRLNDTRLPSAN